MPRRKRGRWMHRPPQMRGFKPFGTPLMNSEPVVLLLEEYEAIKLADYNDLNQKDAALKMGVSRPTFTRIYDTARKKVAKAFVEGQPIIIHGGNVEFRDNWYRCLDCNRVFRIDKGIDNSPERLNDDDKNIKHNENIIKCPFCGSKNVISVEELHRKNFNNFPWF